MKKRLLSTLLMGAFFIASMSMFVSCKDYDDDINANANDIVALQKQLETLNSSVTALQASAANYASKSDLASLQKQVAALVTVDNLNQVKTELQNLIAGKVDKSEYDAKVKEIASRIDAIDGRLNTLGTTLNNVETGYKAADTNLQSQIDALNTFKDAVTAGAAKYQAELEKLTAGSAQFQTQLDQLTADLAAIKNELASSSTIEGLKTQMAEATKKVDALTKNLNILTVYVKRNISSLVLKPAAYYGGIEGIEVLTDSAQTYKEGKNLTWFTFGSVLNLSGVGVAQYHVNPATADISNATVAFYSNVADLNAPLAEALTRGASDVATPVYSKTDDLLSNKYFANGILSVPFKANFDLINKNLKANKGSFIAAQISKGDTTVTSDYAVVVPTKIYNLLVADKSFTTAPYTDNIATPLSGHLHKKFSELAVDAVAATHSVKYNESINISALLETHFTKDPTLGLDSADVTLAADKVGIMDAATFKALGLKYVVKTVQYTVGSNKTSETAHIQLAVDAAGDVIATPRNVDASGKTIENEVANASAVGRLPMLVIEIQDANGTILAYGYMKLLITDLDEAPKQDVTSDAFKMNDFYFDCNGAADSLTWSQVEFHIYNDLLKISKKTFDETYKFEAGTQYVLEKTGYVASNNPIGVVEEKSNSSSTDATTHVLKWTLDATSQSAAFTAAAVKNGVSTKDLTVIVKYANQKGGGDVYIPLTIPAGKLHFATANLKNTKTLSQWYQYQSSVNATNADDAFEVRANVPVPQVSDNVLENTEFVKDLHDYFLNGTLSAALNDAAKYPELAAAMKNAVPSFEFTLPLKGVNADFSATSAGQWTVKGYSGKEYTLQLSDDKMAIQTKDGVNIVTMDAQGVVTYVEGEVADDILNYVGHDKLGNKETFTAYVQIVLPELCYQPAMNATYFNVRFLRPLNLSEAKPYEIVDAPNDWQEIPFASLVGVTDWRDYTGLADNSNGGKSDGKKQFDFAYYGIEFEADVNGALTDANLGTAQRNNFTNTDEYRKACVNALTNIVNLKLEQDGDVVKYINNSGNTGTYHIFLPIKMKYVFGNFDSSKQNAWAVITVKNTEGNAKRSN